MFGVKGQPFTESFEWGRWSRSARDLRAQGATEVMTDAEAARRGYQVRRAKAYALHEAQSKARSAK